MLTAASCQRSVPRALSLACSKMYATAAAPAELKKTKFYDFNVSKGGKMVEFGGYLMPLQFGSVGIIESHKTTRSAASIFDVSHMLQLKFVGAGREQYIESMCTADVKALKNQSGSYTLFTNEQGGVFDDALVHRYADHMYVVWNAGHFEEKVAYLEDSIKKAKAKNIDVNYEIIPAPLIALQGPKAQQALEAVVDGPANFDSLYFMEGTFAKISGIDCRVTRCGYTGEDGFEISISPQADAVAVVEALLQKSSFVELAGLGARDTLRLESGLCLYGQDLNPTWTPIEASLAWTISKRRRQEGGFPGSEIIVPQIAAGVKEKRVGFVGTTRRVPRAHSPIIDPETKTQVGVVTSGSFSPNLNRPIGMAYINTPFATIGKNLHVEGAGGAIPIEVAKLPFVKLGYKMPPKQQ